LINKQNLNIHTGPSKNPNCFLAPGRHIIIGLLLGAIFVNIVQFPAIERNITWIEYPALKKYPSHDLADIGRYYAGSTARAMFGPYLALSQIAPGINVIVPNDSPLENGFLYGLGLINNAETVNYDPNNILLNIDLNAYDIISLGGSENRPPGKVFLLVGSKKPQSLILIKQDEIVYLVDLNLIPSKPF
jgi:hypothetical protein